MNKEEQNKIVPGVGCIFLHTINGSPGSFVRVRELSLALAKLGANMYILTPFEDDKLLAPNVQIRSIPNMALRFGLASTLYAISRKAYYSKYVSGLLTNKSNWFLEQISNKLVKTLRNSNINILQAEQDFSLSACVKVKRDIGLPLIADIHNITAEELVAAGVIERDNRHFRELQHDTADLLSFADMVVVVSDLMKRYVESEYNITSSKVAVVPPGGRTRVQRIAQEPQLNIVYSGLVSYRENVELFVKSMPFIKKRHKDARFFITRKGESLSYIDKLASSLAVNPEYFWYENSDEFYRFLGSCYLGALPSSNNTARKMGTPVKLFDYLSLGLPVVANDVGGWTEIISEYNVGVLTDNDPLSFADGVDELITNREKYSENALRLIAEHYNWNNSATIMFDVYKKFS